MKHKMSDKEFVRWCGLVASWRQPRRRTKSKDMPLLCPESQEHEAGA